MIPVYKLEDKTSTDQSKFAFSYPDFTEVYLDYKEASERKKELNENFEGNIFQVSENVLTTKTTIYTIAHISAIISAEMFEKVYEFHKDTFGGIVGVTDAFAIWALEFYEKIDSVTNWEEVLEDKTADSWFNEVICWDDAIIKFAHEKLHEIVG